MGESVVEASNLENKKREETSLEVSVSFGRFENDSLSWEKWSTFSPNKYLEEVGKCSTPGSVAQKKAYFEAHYKKIAARKAEETEQEEKQMVDDTSANGDEYGVLPTKSTSRDDNNLGLVNENSSERDDKVSGDDNKLCVVNENSSERDGEVSGNDNKLVVNEKSSERDEEVSGDDNKLGVVNENSSESDEEVSGHSEESNESAAMISPLESSMEEINNSLHSHLEEEKLVESAPVKDYIHTGKSQLKNVELPPVVVLEDKHVNEVHEEKVKLAPVLVQGDSHSDESSEKLESPENFEKETRKFPGNGKEKAKLVAPNTAQKMNAKERNLGTAKKKPSSPSPVFSTPKTSKPTLVSTSLSSSRSSTKKGNDSPSLRSKTNSTGVKKVAPSAMHMSLNFEPANSEATPLTTTRKSLIMESMGDKDIVKRAFRQFQNNFNQKGDGGDERSTGQKVASTTVGQNLSTSLTPRKENQGVRKTPEKMDAQRAQLGRSWNTTSVRSLRGTAMDKKSAKPAPYSSGLRSDERAEKRKEAVKKLEEKPRTKGAEKPRIASKSKEEKETDSSKLTRSLISKASPLPGFGHGPVVKKSPLDKGGVKSERLHRPEMHR